MKPYDDKRALILGGTSGIGLAIADLLTENGVYVEKYGSDIKIENEYSLNIFSKYKWDIIISSVGTLLYKNECIIKNFKESSYDEWMYMNNIHYLSAYYITKLAINSMPNGGHLLFIGSSSIYNPKKNFSLYTPAKCGLNSFVECVSKDLQEDNIKINIINPPTTNTKIIKCLNIDKNKKIAEPNDIAKNVLKYLTSNISNTTHSKNNN